MGRVDDVLYSRGRRGVSCGTSLNDEGDDEVRGKAFVDVVDGVMLEECVMRMIVDSKC